MISFISAQYAQLLIIDDICAHPSPVLFQDITSVSDHPGSTLSSAAGLVASSSAGAFWSTYGDTGAAWLTA